ncbi:MAG TPA: BTAD domain-containing putative transcriptional regulator [Gemmatimonadaceae bacterium]|nr:BTAD domain-containing putative transcriptional regulator [Gemmatimonadaceae bacterium]
MMGREAGLALRLFGAARITGAGRERAVELLAKPKTLALLAYLAMASPRGLHRRDVLLALLWPDSDSGHARNSSRQGLHMLRSHLPPGSLASRGNAEVGLDSRDLEVDVTKFEDLLDRGHVADAMVLYDGPLLDGFSLFANTGFDAWLSGERERLQSRAVRAAMVLARRHELDGDNTAAAEWSHFALVRSPYDEDLLRTVIEMLVRRGDRAAATLLYHSAVDRFRTGLGVAVSPATARLGQCLAAEGEERPVAVGRALTMAGSPTGRARAAASTPPIAFARPRVVTAAARRLCLDARQLAGRHSPLTILSAISRYEQALHASPDYAEAHAGLATALCQAVTYISYPGRDEAWPRACAHASRALRLDPLLGEAHTVLAHVALCQDYNWPLAEELYCKALEVDPVSVVSRTSYALEYLTATGRTDEALAVLDRARDKIPDVPAISAVYAMSCAFGRRYESGLREAEFVLESDPTFIHARWVRGMAQEGLGDIAGAIATFELAVETTDRSSLLLAQLGRACARAGHRARAMSILCELDARNEASGPAAFYGVEILAALGSTELALDRLYAAYRQRNPFLVFAGVLYGLDPLRGTRRFRDLLMRIGLPACEHNINRARRDTYRGSSPTRWASGCAMRER